MTEEELLQVIEKAAKDKRESLDLSFKGLTSIPPEIGQLTNLTSLSVSFKELTEFPSDVIKLNQLTELDLSDSHLTSIPPEIG